MGRPQARVPGAASTSRLVCLDRSTGQLCWIKDPAQIPNNTGNVHAFTFGGSPLAVGDNVYVIARGSNGAGVEDCHVVCYELRTGNFKWICYIASSQTNTGMAFGMGAFTPSETESHLSLASGRIYVLTNLGAVGAVDAYSGSTAWISLYPRNPTVLPSLNNMMRFGGQPMPTTTSIRPWDINGAIVHDGKIFVLPIDGRHLLIYDMADGHLVKRLKRQFSHSDDNKRYRMTMLLGIRNNTIVVCGNFTVNPSGGSGSFFATFDWTGKPPTHDPEELSYDSLGNILELPRIEGRPLLTTNRALIPHEERLVIIDLEKNRVAGLFPKNGKWSAEDRGNIVGMQDHIVVAGTKGIHVYTDLGDLKRKYAQRIEADPANLELRLVYSELMFNVNDLAECRKHFDQTIELLGGVKSMRSGKERDRVFSDALLFAQRRADVDKASAEEFFNIAQAAAATPSQQISYRLTRGQFLESADPTAAVTVYQQILSDPQMRQLVLAADDGGAPKRAGRIAEGRIGDLIQKTPNVFREIAAEARVKLDAMANATADQLLDLAETYPNAMDVASAAMLRAAGSYEKENKPRMANLLLRRILWKYGAVSSETSRPRLSDAQRAGVLEAMARNGLRCGDIDGTFGRMRALVAISGDARLAAPLLMEDGKPLARKDAQAVQSYKEAVEALKGMALAPPALPKIVLPTPRTTEERLANKLERRRLLPIRRHCRMCSRCWRRPRT